MSNRFKEKEQYIIRKVSIIDTMRNIPKGKEVLLDAKECGPASTARSAASRLAKSKEGLWVVSSDDNGVTYRIKRVS